MNYFSTRFKYSEEREKIWKILCKYLQNWIPISSKIIDLGAGYCHFINNIKGEEKYAIDINENVLKYASRDIIVFKSPCYEIPVNDSYFDVVFASNLLEHLKFEEVIKTIKEAKRILKKDGRFIILSPNFRYCYRNYFDDYTHKLILTDRSIYDLLEANEFKIEKIFKKFLPFSIETRMPKSSFLLKLYLYSPIKPFAGQMLIIAKNAC